MIDNQLKRFGWHLNSTIAKLVSLILRFPFTSAIYCFTKDHNATPKKLKDYLEWGAMRATILHPSLSKNFKTGKALIVYFSITGNTEKVALAIEKGIRKAGLKPTVRKISEAVNEDYYEYDLVCFGTPVIHALPPKPVMKFVNNNFDRYRVTPSKVQVPALPIPGKYALVFVTFSGPHVGVDEALPAGKFLVQEFEHLGFEIRGEWYIVGEFHGWVEGSTRGKLGDIRGRPNREDIRKIEEKTIKLVRSLNRISLKKDIWVNQ